MSNILKTIGDWFNKVYTVDGTQCMRCKRYFGKWEYVGNGYIGEEGCPHKLHTGECNCPACFKCAKIIKAEQIARGIER